jgi:folate-binding protein YgfZ
MAPASRPTLARLAQQFLAGRRAARRRDMITATPSPTSPSHQRPFSSAAAAATPAAATANLSASGARAVLRLRGKGALQFLQGMVTNDMRPLMGAAPSSRVAYAALLTAKGKLIEDVFVHRCLGGGAAAGAEEEETLLLDVGAAGKREALAWLARYRLRRPLALDDASSDMHVWAAWGGGEAPQPPLSGSSSNGTGWRADPRLPAAVLGWRGVFEAGAGIDSAAASAGGHRRMRYALAVPEGAAEMLSAGGGGAAAASSADNAAAPASQQQRAPNPLEFGLDVLNGVSYDKGCYIGQERNSFTHYRGVIRRRALPVRLEAVAAGAAASAANVTPGAPVLDRAGKPVGTLMAAEGDLGLAHLTLARALPGGEAPAVEGQEEGGASFVVAAAGGGSVSVVPLGRPAWWPPEWGREELQQQQQQQQQA